MKRLFSKSNKCSSEGGANFTNPIINESYNNEDEISYKSENNKRKLVTITYGLLVVLILTVASYALFDYSFLGSRNDITRDEIVVNFLESSDGYLGVSSSIPISDTEGMAQQQTYDFQVTTKTANEMAIGYKLSIKKLEASPGYTNLDDSMVKVYLTDYNDNVVVPPTLVSDLENYVLYEHLNSHDEENSLYKDKYKIRIWIDENVTGEDLGTEDNLQYNFEIDVDFIEKQTTNSVSDLSVSLLNAKYTYDGSAKTPEVLVKDRSKVLVEGTDYTVTYKDNINAGAASVVITGKGDYTGTVTKKFIIGKAESVCSISTMPSLEYAKNTTGNIVYNCTGDGKVSLVSSDENLIEVGEITNTNVKITALKNGEGTVTLKQAEGSNYKKSNEVTKDISVGLSSYTVNVVVQNGSVDTASKSIKYGANGSFTISASTGYGNPTVSCTNSQSASISGSTLTVSNVTKDTTCTVTYKANTYNITYNLDGGSVSSNPSTYNIESNSFNLNSPSKTGYVFKGWKDSQDGILKIDDVSMPYTMTATGDNTFSSTKLQIFTASGTYIGQIGNVSATGHYSSSYNFNSDSGTYKIRFGANGSKADDTFYFYADLVKGKKYIFEWDVTTFSSTKIVVDNLRFYQDGGNNTSVPVESIKKCSYGNKTLTAKWAAATYTVTLTNTSATTSGTTSVTSTYNSSSISPSTITLPKRAYTVSGFGTADSRNSTGATISSTSTLTSTYTFNGWYTGTSGGSKVINNSTTPAYVASVSGYTDANSKWVKASAATLYAQWSSKSVTLPTITKTGYTCGWTTSSTGTTISYASGATYTPSANTPMYAVCTANNYKLVQITNNNILNNGDFESYSISSAPTSTANGVTHSWDGNLNGVPGDPTKAYYVNSWGYGANMGVAVPEIGYHAHMRIVNGNNVLRFKTNEDYAGKTDADVSGGSVTPGTVSTGRWLGFSQSITGTKLKAGSTYVITMDIYRVSGTTYSTGGLYYATNANTTRGFKSGQYNFAPTKNGEWQTMSWTFTLDSDYLNTITPYIYIYGNSGAPGELYIDNVRLEETTVSTKKYNTTYTTTELTAPTKTGYTFANWYNNKDLTTAISSSSTFNASTATFDNISKADTIAKIYAKWNINKYTVNVVVQNGTVDTASKQVEYNKSGTFNLTNNIGTDYTSVSCTNSQTASVSGGVLTVSNVTNNTTCTVVYTEKTYTVTYSSGSTGPVSGLPSSQTKRYSKALTLTSSIPVSADDDEFLGWATKSNATESENIWYDPSGTYSTNQNITLYGQWYDVDTLETEYTGFTRSGDFVSKSRSSSLSVAAWATSTIETASSTSGYKGLGVVSWQSSASGMSFYSNKDIDAINSHLIGLLNAYTGTLTPTVTANRLQLLQRTGSVTTGTVDDRILNIQNVKQACLSISSNDVYVRALKTSDITISAKSSASGSVSGTLDGYTLMGNVGHDLYNGATNGVNVTHVFPYGVSGTTIYVRNPYNSQAKVAATIYQLFIRNKSVGTATTPSYGEYPTLGQKRLSALNSLQSVTSDYFNHSNVGITTLAKTGISTSSSATQYNTTVALPTKRRLIGVTGFQAWNDAGSGRANAVTQSSRITTVNSTTGSLHTKICRLYKQADSTWHYSTKISYNNYYLYIS